MAARKPRTSAPRAATLPLWIIQVFGMAGLAYIVLRDPGSPDFGAMSIFAGLVLLSIGGRQAAEVLAGLRREPDDPR